MSDLPPLADLLRPKTLTKVVGQDHLIGPDGSLGQMVQGGRLAPMV
ncbi:MAG: Holliday junction DNA helicase [Rhodospirillaceae bacterium]|nr:MAG: Holliday junction DNA helicase [Rhodospirillaceae bacterium]